MHRLHIKYVYMHKYIIYINYYIILQIHMTCTWQMYQILWYKDARVRDRIFHSFKKYFNWLMYLLINLFILERGEGKEKERERNISVWLPLTCPLLRAWPATQASALIGNWTRDPLFHRPALNPLNYTTQGENWFSFLDLILTIYMT